ncbi:5'-AMP-activated protein kinase subunit beta-2 [Exaiptasia diaphana]|uniref:5'-AMP-activated protein kinase subunit beta-1 n=1 Tax=Exaiptasia diaphana TaxID=2652724 RepID=A0A913X0N4_EXADI|nr:5'-AMP-activated protein kinase subunit beta-2 [Exaiptasia diaphana]KXJ27495.1 5'-AMP-activated protein kinase subunit beta-2 [Exaiptasia diaphana]
MGNTQGSKLKDGKSESSSTLEFETGKKTFPSEQEAKMAREANLIVKEEPSDFDFDLDEDIEAEPPKKMTIPTVFQWVNGGQNILLSGSFNEWKTRIPMTYSHNEFTAIIELPEGEHEYKFCVDGKWIHDPNLPTANDNFGGRNNVITVRNTDMDVFDALDMDANASIGSGSVKSLSGSSPPGSYGQIIPSHNTPVIVRDGMHASVPPVLPPHLLHVILNKDVVDHDDPSLLPEPDHVSLNHLYALSIKDGVMALSVTHRYREKYVSTLLYKPINVE